MPVALLGTSRTTVRSHTPLPQIVPSRVCLTCHVCCRFPERDSFLRPYFTGEEIQGAVARGIDPGAFPDPAGSQVTVVPNPQGDGYLCPAFDPTTSHCRIYESRPLDCQLYPLAVMWNANHDRVVLGWDTTCPFMREQAGEEPGARGERAEVEAYAERMASLVEQNETLEIFAMHPRLIGRFQEDVIVLRVLPRLTERLRVTGDESRVTGKSEAPDRSRHLSPLTLADRSKIEQALASSSYRGATPLAAYSFAYHYVWHSLLSCWWVEIDGHLCLFAESPDGIFMPLPPLGTGPITRALAEGFRIMQERNRGTAVTRVENVPAGLTTELDRAGYRLTPKDADYLYRTADLVTLAGDRYKSQRAGRNRFGREHGGRLESYEDRDRDECLALFHDWRDQKLADGLDEPARWLLADSKTAHHEAFTHHAALGLDGAVVRVNGVIRAYTFGYWLTPSVFCLLLEVADRTIPGLAQFLFREFCARAQTQGADVINTMDDSGLASLTKSKQAYHPIERISNWIATV